MNRIKLAVIAMFLTASFASFAFADGSYGGLYVSAGATPQALSATAAKMTGFVTALPNDSTDTSVTPVAASDHITLIAGGVYLIHFDCAALIGTADIIVTYSLRDGATAITGATCAVASDTGTEALPISTSMTFIYKPSAAATLSVYAVSASGTPNLTPVHAQLIVTRIQ